MLSLFATAFLLGLVFNAAPGAVFAETVRQGVRGGFRPALAVQAGSLVGDALWALLGLLGVGMLLQLDFLRLPVGLAGAGYLLLLARDAWLAARQEFSVVADDAGLAARPALRVGVMLSVTNPHNVAYWAALGSAMGAVGIAQPTMHHYGVFFAGFMVSSLVWALFCAAVVARLFRGTTTRWARLTYRLCAVALLALAISSLRDLFQEPAAQVGDRAPAVVSRR
jgi:chemosensory pili system protein ChpE/L-lysine exporter family protein LysE/ArgO